MSALTRLSQKVKAYRSTEAREIRKKKRAEQVVNKLMAQAGRTLLETRRLEIKSDLARAKAKAELARAEELEARAKRKKAEKELRNEGVLGQMIRGLSGSQALKRQRRKKRQRHKK